MNGSMSFITRTQFETTMPYLELSARRADARSSIVRKRAFPNIFQTPADDIF